MSRKLTDTERTVRRKKRRDHSPKRDKLIAGKSGPQNWPTEYIAMRARRVEAERQRVESEMAALGIDNHGEH